MNRDLVVPLDEVDLGEDATASEVGGEVVKVRDWIGVAGGALVEPAIVAAGAGGAVFLGNHVEAGAPRRVGTAADACDAHEVEILFCDSKLFGRQTPRRHLDRRARGIDETLDAVAGRASC